MSVLRLLPSCDARSSRVVATALAVVSLFVVPACALAADHRSGFGFGFQLSDDWLVLTRPEIQRAFQGDTLSSVGLPLADPATLDTILQKVKSGQVEMIYDRRYSTKDWNNNITIQRIPARTRTPEQLVQASCPTLATDLRATMGTEVKVASCGVRTIAGVSFVAYEYWVAAQKVSIVQFEIPFGFSGTLVLSGASNDAGLANLRAAQLAVAGGVIGSLHAAPTAAPGASAH